MNARPAAQFSLTLRVRLDNEPGVLGRLATAVGDAGGNIFAIEGFVAKGPTLERDIVVNCGSVAHQGEIVEIAKAVAGVTVLDSWDRTFRMHEGGKIEVLPLHPVGDADDLAMAVQTRATPGV
ncbi:MAG: ACT domain-containing protein [Actinomycetota bacterium]